MFFDKGISMNNVRNSNLNVHSSHNGILLH